MTEPSVCVKFCGLQSEADARAAAALQPDFCGVILASGYRRTVSVKTAAGIRSVLPEKIRLAGVFVRESPDQILDMVQEAGVDLVQLHGPYAREDILELKQKTSLPVWQAFSVHNREDLEQAWASAADEILLDAGCPGSGCPFDWSLLQQAKRRFILAGGLQPSNAEAAAGLGPWCLDVSSGIETDGKKDPEKMKQFLQAVRS